MKKQGIKKTAIVLSALVSLSALPSAAMPSVFAANDSSFPYALFASSAAKGAITVDAKHFTLNGNIAANGTIETGKKVNINGKKTENAGKEMLFVGDKLTDSYFANAEVSDGLNLSKSNINLNKPLDVIGDASLSGNVNLSSGIKADEDISISGNVSNLNCPVLYSEFGDITIDCNNVNLNGIVYAPLGNVEIRANNINLNNAVIIADTITLVSNNVNANYGKSYADKVGNVSEARADYIHKYNSYLMNKDIDDTLDLISKYYTLTPVDTGEYKQLNIFNMYIFDIAQYKVEGYGNLSIMKTDGANQMATIVLSPFEKDLPLISTDYMFNGESHISYIEFYGLSIDADSQDFQNVVGKLNGLTARYADLMSVTPTPAWYDEIRTTGLFKMTSFTEGDKTAEMLSDSFKTTLEASKKLPQLNDAQKAAKVAAVQQYSDNLVDMGGISTDMFKMVLGPDTTKAFFNNIFFGTAQQ